MVNDSDFFVTENSTIADAMERINSNLLKAALVLRENKLAGTIGDGDIRRALMNGGSITDKVGTAANYSPIFIYENQMETAGAVLKERKISVLPVLNFNHEVVDVFTPDRIFPIAKQQLSVPVVIMAGGRGTRLYPYTKILPKPLIPVGELPIVEHIINRFHKYGCSRFYMIVNYKKNMIHSYFDYVERTYELDILDENKELGTGGGLSLLKNTGLDDFFLTNCDIIIDADYNQIYEEHRRNHNFITIICARKQNKIPYGVVMVEEGMKYAGMKEKPCYEVIVNTGLYLVNGRVVRGLDMETAVDFPDIIEHYRRQGEKVGVYIIDEDAFMDMGQMTELEEMWKRIGGIEN